MTPSAATADDGAPVDAATPAPESPTAIPADEAPLTSTVRDAPFEPATELPPELVGLTSVDIDAVWRRGCVMWDITPFRDHGAINDAVYSFLTSEPGVLKSRFHDLDLLNEAVADACRAEDASAGWITLSASLELSNEDFGALFAASCENFFRSNEARDPDYRPDVVGWDRFLLQVVGVDDLWDVLDEVCDGFG